ncbi:hypothetical protein [Leucobacter sp. NPDC077196]|uniref:DUF7882 family protein n=1 Tax=Leucobacter sp. NPDC077196 TaxID=3154959 RepID=UPI00341E7374
MGKLIIGGTEYEFEDRLLAHLKFVIGQKLKTQECFFLSWEAPGGQGAGNTAIWLSPHIPMTFCFSGSREPALSKPWAVALKALSHTPRGLVAITEEDAAKYFKKNPDLM